MNDSRRLRPYGASKKKAFLNFSVTHWIIAVNVICFLIFFTLISINENYVKYVALKPSYFFQGKYLWTVLTSMFMHGNFFHLFVNMFVLFSLGGLCEKIIGGKRYFWFYLLAGIFAGLLFVFLAYFFGNTELGAAVFGGPDAFAVGASGAIFGIAALFMILTPRLRFSIIFLPFFSLPGYIMIPLVLFVVWIVSSYFALVVGVEGGIGNTAHFGGFLAGIIYGLYLKNKYKRKTKMIARYFSS
jgi:membrane associated rhomboid family serine protease